MANIGDSTLHGQSTTDVAERIALAQLTGQSSRAELVAGMRAAMQGDAGVRRQLREQLLNDVSDARDKARLLTREQINSDPRALDAIEDLTEIDARWGGSNGLVSRAVRHVDKVLSDQGDWLKGWPDLKVPKISEMAQLQRDSGNWDSATWEAQADTIDSFLMEELEALRLQSVAPSSDLSSGQDALRVAMEGIPPLRAPAMPSGIPTPEQSWDRARARVVDQAPVSRADDFGR